MSDDDTPGGNELLIESMAREYEQFPMGQQFDPHRMVINNCVLIPPVHKNPWNFDKFMAYDKLVAVDPLNNWVVSCMSAPPTPVVEKEDKSPFAVRKMEVAQQKLSYNEWPSLPVVVKLDCPSPVGGNACSDYLVESPDSSPERVSCDEVAHGADFLSCE